MYFNPVMESARRVIKPAGVTLRGRSEIIRLSEQGRRTETRVDGSPGRGLIVRDGYIASWSLDQLLPALATFIFFHQLVFTHRPLHFFTLHNHYYHNGPQVRCSRYVLRRPFNHLVLTLQSSSSFHRLQGPCHQGSRCQGPGKEDRRPQGSR